MGSSRISTFATAATQLLRFCQHAAQAWLFPARCGDTTDARLSGLSTLLQVQHMSELDLLCKMETNDDMVTLF